MFLLELRSGRNHGAQGATRHLLQQAGLPSRDPHHHRSASRHQHKQETTHNPPSLSKWKPKKTKCARCGTTVSIMRRQQGAAPHRAAPQQQGQGNPEGQPEVKPQRGIHFVQGMTGISKTESGCAARPQGANSIRGGFADTQTSMLPGKTRERNVRSKF